jgi:hypothetical protein
MTHGKKFKLHRRINIFLVEVAQSAIDSVHGSTRVEAQDSEVEGGVW